MTNRALHLVALAHERSVSTLGLVEATEPDATGLARAAGAHGLAGEAGGPRRSRSRRSGA